jgi:SPP1 gp7 family putative phage head morphogenesis protein
MAITIGDQQLQLADDFAQALDGLADRASTNTRRALVIALRRTLRDLRRWYGQAVDPELPAERSADGQLRRPGSYSIAESSRKLQDLQRIAQAYFNAAELKALEQRYATDLEQATALGDDLARQLLQTTDPEVVARSQFVGPNRAAIRAAAATTSAYIRAEVESFRDNLTRIVTQGVARGQGYRKIERDVRIALLGARDPNGITRSLGLANRAELIARSELSNAYVGAQKATAERNGMKYARWIATKDERTCPVCASRHGNIYLLAEMVGTQHPRCRCSLAPVATEAVEEADPKRRATLLREGYWERSREAVTREFAAGKGWPFDRASKVLGDALRKPSPSEKRQFPGIGTAALPVL